MKKNLIAVFASLIILVLLLGACQSAPAESAAEEAPAEEAAAEEVVSEPEQAGELEKVTIVADWPTPWVGFIPWLVAQEKGFYAEEGLEVETILPATVADPPKYVALGKADFAYTTQLDVILGRAAGIPIVSTAAVFRYNNWGVI